jgi:Na+/H+-dicarboxylate symporter
MVLGIIWSITMASFKGGHSFTADYIKPIGSIFIKLLQMLAIPLILTSIVGGISQLKDLNKLGRIGIRTLILFTFTCTVATIIGISLASLLEPGKNIPESTKKGLLSSFEQQSSTLKETSTLSNGPLDMLVEVFPNNVMNALSHNSMMIQVVVFALLFGIALLKVNEEKGNIVFSLIDALNEVFMQLVLLIMKAAPFGVFALVASIAFDPQLFLSLFYYILTVLIGLSIILFIVYPAIVVIFTKVTYKEFFNIMKPVFLLAFSTSSSAATLPVTMERVRNGFKVKKEIADFVLSLGTTVNMDGTALYQSIAAVFIAQATGIELSIEQLIIIALTATLAAVGAAGIPGAGMITLIIVLDAIHVPIEAIAFIMAPDRLLDMFRTIINVAGDACGALFIASKEKDGFTTL